MHSDLPSDPPAGCCHCGGLIEDDPTQGWLWVPVGTRSRRCPGADATTEAEVGLIPL